jgi:hypothetical protein
VVVVVCGTVVVVVVVDVSGPVVGTVVEAVLPVGSLVAVVAGTVVDVTPEASSTLSSPQAARTSAAARAAIPVRRIMSTSSDGHPLRPDSARRGRTAGAAVHLD